jgi:hypothetical protein
MHSSQLIRSLRSVTLLSILLGCAPVPVATDTISASPVPSDNIWITTGTYTETPSALVETASQTPSPTARGPVTISPTPYPTLFPPGFSPTPRLTPTPGLPATATLAPVETCPKPTHEPVEIRLQDYPLEYEQPILDYLTANGEIQKYKTQLESIDMELHKSNVPFDIHMDVFEQDVTGDGIQEFLLVISGNGKFDILEESDPERPVLFIIGCRGREYIVMHRIRTLSTIKINSIMDLNADGITEIAYSFIDNFGANHGRFTFQLQVLEWDGADFRELLLDPYRYPRSSAQAAFRDLDGNGTMEILIPQHYWGENGGGVDCDIGPTVDFDEVWMWDGEYYHYMWRENAAPVYRFQAALYGDYLTSLGLYDRAELNYLRAVFDLSLKPGSRGDWMRDGECYGNREVSPEATEPPRISAYARFRLVELLVRIHRVMEAESHRSYLRTNYPLGSPGYIYAYLANAFWWEYVKDEDITAACAMVRLEAEKFQTDVFGLFETYGAANPGSAISNICPF